MPAKGAPRSLRLQRFLGINVIPAGFAIQRMARLGPGNARRLARALDHYPVTGQRQRGFQQCWRIRVITHQWPEQAHFLFHQRGFLTMGKIVRAAAPALDEVAAGLRAAFETR